MNFSPIVGFGLLEKRVDDLPVKLEVSAVGCSRFEPRRECCWTVAEEALSNSCSSFPNMLAIVRTISFAASLPEDHVS